MRFVLIALMLFAVTPAQARQLAAPPPSAANLLRLHPAAWRMPAGSPASAMRFEPETSELPAVTLEPGSPRAAASARARAASEVRMHADGSRHAVVGSALRSWTVASIDEAGRLVQDCVHSEADALRRVESSATRQVRK